MNIEFTKIVDLSLKLHSNMALYPGDPPIDIRPILSMPGDRVNILGINMSTHHGTHVDAPYHQVADGRLLDEFPLDTFIKNAIKIDVVPGDEGSTSNKKAGILYRQVVTGEDMASYAEMIARVEAVVIHTGYGRLLLKGEVDEDFPYLDESAAEFLGKYKNLKIIGIDSLTVDAYQENRAHHILFADGKRILVETLVHLDELPSHFTLCCFPTAIANTDGAPCRAVALC